MGVNIQRNRDLGMSETFKHGDDILTCAYGACRGGMAQTVERYAWNIDACDK